jgi:hypothetical protein
LPAALALAGELGCLPRDVTIWGIAIDQAQPGTGVSPALAAAVPNIANRICRDLDSAEHFEAVGDA